MNPQGPRGIEYLTRTWNPVTGCNHQKMGVCSIDRCWAHNMAARNLPGLDDMVPRFHRDRLEEPLRRKKPSRIGVTFYGDLWGEWVSETWIEAVLDVCRRAHWHRFIFLTKNPRRYGEFEIPENCWCGTSISGGDEWKKLLTLAKATPHSRRFISWEPATGDGSVVCAAVDWLIIGGKSGRGACPANRPEVEFVLNIASVSGVPVFIKNNAKWPNRIQQYPPELLLPGEM